jgi:ribosomal-protein-alanine N-acetyltransferase
LQKATISAINGSMRLETARLIIRSIEPGDGNAWVSMLNDPQVRRFLPPFPEVTLESFGETVERRRKMERERGYAIWTVALKETNEMIGQCGLLPAEGKGPEIEIAYHFSSASWNKGYATEAVVAVLEHAFRSSALDRVIAIIMPENIGSQRVAERAGMRFDSIATYFDIPGLKKYVAECDSWRSS